MHRLPQFRREIATLRRIVIHMTPAIKPSYL